MTKICAGFILVIALATSVASAQTSSAARNTSADSAEIVRLEHVLTDAWLKTDTATVFSMFADDYEYWSFKGIRRNKSDLRRMFQNPSADKEQATKLDDAVVRVYGDVAVFTSHIIDTGKHADGSPFSITTAVTIIWARRQGKWQIVADHETILPGA